MAKSNQVTNHYTGPLGVGGVVIEPNASAEVPNWEEVSKNGVVAKWLESGVLSVSKSGKKDEPEVQPEVVEEVQLTEQEPESAAEEVAEDPAQELSEDEQKEVLIVQLAELGVKADKRSSVEKLQEKLDEALAK